MNMKLLQVGLPIIFKKYIHLLTVYTRQVLAAENC